MVSIRALQALCLSVAVSVTRAQYNSSACSASTWRDLHYEGIAILDIDVSQRQDYTQPGEDFTGGDVSGLNFCNVTIVYTHIGWNDSITLTNWLPLDRSTWNGRFLATGGGGFTTGGGSSFQSLWMAPFSNEGYAVATTDGGHANEPSGIGFESPWSLLAPGILNLPLIYDFSSVALHDMATMSKDVISAYFDEPLSHSYFIGLSTGGRQANMLTQKYPNDFDGLVGIAPAMQWTKFLVGNVYAQFIMNTLNYYPQPCEVDAFSFAAIQQCDGLDGVEDGFISHPGLCHFDPFSVVGQTFECNGKDAKLTEDGAKIVQAAWDGPRSATGDFQWYGFPKDTNISSVAAQTLCHDNGTCGPNSFPISKAYISHWVEKDPNFDFASITHEDWDRIFHDSIDQFWSVIDASNPDLSAFKRSGGKFIGTHGISDQAIPVNGTIDFVDKMLELDPAAQDYYRFFLTTGDSHGTVQIAPPSSYLMQTIVDWVENGIAPETLESTGIDRSGRTLTRASCLYPKISHFVGGDLADPSSFTCV